MWFMSCYVILYCGMLYCIHNTNNMNHELHTGHGQHVSTVDACRKGPAQPRFFSFFLGFFLKVLSLENL